MADQQTDPAKETADTEESSILKKYAITKVPTYYYEVGGFRYSNLKDAVEQAKRK